MDEFDTGWSSNISSDNCDRTEESEAVYNWCEISLGSEEEQELSGRLRFRKDSRCSVEMPSVEATDGTVESTCKLKDNHQPDKQDGTDVKPQGSLAYSFGMMFVHGAANVVNNVADGGKRNRDVIKELRSDLDDMTEKYEGLQRELENSKQWIIYYENLKSNLENQIVETNKNSIAERRSMQEKLKKSEREVDSCRKEVENAVIVKDRMISEIDEARTTIGKLKCQIEKAQLQTEATESVKVQTPTKEQQHEQSHSTPSMVSTVATQACITMALHDASTNTHPLPSDQTKPSMELRQKERQLADATNALCIAQARGDKLRNQLLLSSEAMKSQIAQMKASRIALETALNESRHLKDLLNTEKKKHKETEQMLEEESRRHHLTVAALEEQKRLLCETEEKAFAKHIDMLAIQKEMKNEDVNKKRLLKESMLTSLAGDLVSQALNSAFTFHLRRLYSKKICALKNATERKSEKLKIADFTTLKLQKQVQCLELQLKNKEADLDQYKKKIQALMAEADSNKSIGVETEKREAGLKNAISAAELKFSQTKLKLEKLLKNKTNEASQVNLQIEALVAENERLHEFIMSRKTETVTSCSQTDLLGSDINKFEKQISESTNKNLELSRRALPYHGQSVTNNHKPSAMKFAVLEKQDQISRMEGTYLDLQYSLDQNKRLLRQRNYALLQSEEECKRLNWSCQKHHTKLSELNCENAELRDYIERYLSFQAQNINSNDFPKDVITEQNKQPEQYNNALESHIYDQGDTKESRRSSLSHLDTIPETDELSSATNSHKSYRTKKDENTSGGISNESGSVDYRTFSDSEADKCALKASSRVAPITLAKHKLRKCSKKRVKNLERSIHNEHISACAEEHEHALPIWRRERSLQKEAVSSSLGSTSLNASFHDIHSAGDKDDDVFSDLQTVKSAIRQRKIGVPMSEEAFNQVLAGSSTPCNVIEFSQDDGYSSSSNSILDELHQQTQIWESTELNTVRSRAATNNFSHSSSEDTGLPENNLADNEKRHYIVSYAGITFDLAEFSMTKMREITASCEAISTPQGMNAFFDFLAHKVVELDRNPEWKGHHNLGRPDDWLSLKNYFV